MEQSPSWEADSNSASQIPRPYPEPDESSPQLSTLFPKGKAKVVPVRN
jgi:hypothetical protein